MNLDPEDRSFGEQQHVGASGIVDGLPGGSVEHSTILAAERVFVFDGAVVAATSVDATVAATSVHSAVADASVHSAVADASVHSAVADTSVNGATESADDAAGAESRSAAANDRGTATGRCGAGRH